MKKFMAMLVLGFVVSGMALEAYAQGCCGGHRGTTTTEEVKDTSEEQDS